MNTKIFCLLGLTLLLGTSTVLTAQTLPFDVSNSGNPNPGLHMDTNGTLWSLGTYGTGTLSLSGAGTRMFWYPGKAAFRAGYASSTTWDDANIGLYSTAFGLNSTASGGASFATGSGTVASGGASTAFGSSTQASGSYSFASGWLSNATGTRAAAFGDSTTASSWGAFACGANNLASGAESLATGNGTSATAYYSSAFNSSTTANSYAATAIGQLNVGLSSTGAAPNPSTWVATDPLFEVGNGTAPPLQPWLKTYSDAFVVYKNGNAVFSGLAGASCTVKAPIFLTTQAAGDIPMYTGN